ncbi:hypothetical protein PATSB16_36340 [Pandoraea thiooxydans]|nr:hypothetical protein PATSB16_36340 [Pandoraea thiooxydans]
MNIGPCHDNVAVATRDFGQLPASAMTASFHPARQKLSCDFCLA